MSKTSSSGLLARFQSLITEARSRRRPRTLGTAGAELRCFEEAWLFVRPFAIVPLPLGMFDGRAAIGGLGIALDHPLLIAVSPNVFAFDEEPAEEVALFLDEDGCAKADALDLAFFGGCDSSLTSGSSSSLDSGRFTIDLLV